MEARHKNTLFCRLTLKLCTVAVESEAYTCYSFTVSIVSTSRLLCMGCVMLEAESESLACIFTNTCFVNPSLKPHTVSDMSRQWISACSADRVWSFSLCSCTADIRTQRGRLSPASHWLWSFRTCYCSAHHLHISILQFLHEHKERGSAGLSCHVVATEKKKKINMLLSFAINLQYIYFCNSATVFMPQQTK